MKTIRVDFKTKNATIEFDESTISAQEVARALANTPHMMGCDMHYGGSLVLKVTGLKDDVTGKKAKEALSKVEGVSKVTPYPQQEAVGIDFSGKGKVTTKQLIEALEKAGLKGSQYGAASTSTEEEGLAVAQALPNHASMRADNGEMQGMRMDSSGMRGVRMGSGGMMGCGCACCR